MQKVRQEIVELPVEFDPTHPQVTISSTTANVEDEFIVIECPERTSYVFKAGESIIYIMPKDAANAQITEGTFRVYYASKDRMQKWGMVRVPASKVTELQDKQKVYTLGKTFVLRPDEILLITFESATAADKGNSDFYINGIQVVEKLPIR